MKRLVLAVRQLLPSLKSIIAYWLLALFFIVVASLGLKATGERSGTLWGVALVGWDRPGGVLQQAYMEMMHHVWTFITLPYLCFLGMRPLIGSFRRDFSQFIRYSRSSRLFMEYVRALAAITLVLLVSLPFAVGVAWGALHPGLNWDEGLYLMGSCAGTTLFIAALIYASAILGLPIEVITALAFVAPFFASGLRTYLELQHLASPIWPWLPPGLPYTGIARPWLSGSCIDTNVLTGVGLATGMIVLRVIAIARTRWLLSPQKEAG